MGWGFEADPEDPEWTLNQYRWDKLLTPRETDEGIMYGPENEKFFARIYYEAVKTKLKRWQELLNTANQK